MSTFADELSAEARDQQVADWEPYLSGPGYDGWFKILELVELLNADHDQDEAS